MNKLSLIIAILFSTFFSPHLFSANPLVNRDEQKEDPHPIQRNNQTQQPKQVYDYTILHHKNVNHTLEDIENVEDDLGNDILAINQELVATNNQSLPLLLGAVLQHKQTKKHYQYLITSTGLLSETTQPNAVQRAHEKGFHLIKATRGHISLQLLEWLQVSGYYSVIALYTNSSVCRNCCLITHSLLEKKLKINKKGCLNEPFPPLDKMPNLAQKYINAHLNLSLVQSLVVPIMGYVSKEEMNKAVQQKDKEMAAFIASMQTTKDEQISMLNNGVKAKEKQLDENKEQIEMLNKEINKKDKQLKEKEQIIADFRSILRNIPKQRLDNNTKEEFFEAVKRDNVNKVKLLLDMYQDVVNTRSQNQNTPFLCAAQEGKLKMAELLKEQGANLNAKNKYESNALHLACTYSGSEAMINWLLDECKIGLETKGQYQRTPFLYSAGNGRLGIAKLLRHRGADINAKDEDGNNALHLACLYSSSEEMVIWLLGTCKIGIETRRKDRNTPFLCAAEQGQLFIAQLLKERGASINARDKNGSNALHLACFSSGSEVMILWLLNICKIKLETRGSHQMTPFLCAAHRGQLVIAKLLMEQGADINAKNEDGDSALHLACAYSGSEVMVSWLLKVCRIKIEAKGQDQNTPFLCAANGGQLTIAKLLKQRGANIRAKDECGNNALHIACAFSGSEAMINWLLDKCQQDLETRGCDQTTSFLYAVEKGQLATAKLLKDRDANIHAKDKDGNNALHLACFTSSSEAMITWLLNVCRIGLETKTQNQMTPFLCAASQGQLAIAKLLREQGANLNAKNAYGDNALHIACRFSDSVPMITWLLDACKIDIEIRGQDQMTSFLGAARQGQLKIAKLLRERGADINATGEDGNNALHLACLASGSEAMITWLLDRCNIGIEEKGQDEKTPFLCAASQGQLAAAKLLQQRGANVHAKEEDGNDALHLACGFSGSVPMVAWLLDICNIDIETKGQFQMTPFLCAARQGQLAIAKLLQERGANIRAKDKGFNNALKLAKSYSNSPKTIKWLQNMIF